MPVATSIRTRSRPPAGWRTTWCTWRASSRSTRSRRRATPCRWRRCPPWSPAARSGWSRSSWRTAASIGSAGLGAGGAPGGAAGGSLGGAGSRGLGPPARLVPGEGLLGRQGHHPHVPAGHHQERGVAYVVGRVERSHRGLVDREELAVALVHVVRQPAAISLAGERELALDPVPVGLEDDGFVPQIHGHEP